MKTKYTLEEIKNRPSRTSHLYSLNEVLFNTWIGDRIIWLLANFTKITPNQVTMLGFGSILISAFMFFTNHLILGAIFFNLRWILDLVDGGLAEIKGKTSKFGAFLDPYTGIVGVGMCILALSYKQFDLTGNSAWFLVAFLILFLRSLHCWESPMVCTILRTSAFEKQGKDISHGRFTSRVYKFFAKHRLREPFSPPDLDFLMFVAFPVISVFTGFLLEMWIFTLGIMLLKVVFWFYFYSVTLINRGKKR